MHPHNIHLSTYTPILSKNVRSNIIISLILGVAIDDMSRFNIIVSKCNSCMSYGPGNNNIFSGGLCYTLSYTLLFFHICSTQSWTGRSPLVGLWHYSTIAPHLINKMTLHDRWSIFPHGYHRKEKLHWWPYQCFLDFSIFQTLPLISFQGKSWLYE